MGFPSVYGGLLPLVVVNTAISLAIVKNLVDSLLRIVGLKRGSWWHQRQEEQEQRQEQQRHGQGANFYLDHRWHHQQQRHQSFVEEIQSSLPLVEFGKLIDVSTIPPSPIDIPSPISPSSSKLDDVSSPSSKIEELSSRSSKIDDISTSSSKIDADDRDADDQCAVCLCEFEPSSLVRKLPHCSHIFHGDCLDKWLHHNHTSCPMCRATLLTNDLASRHRQHEELLAEELAIWLSVYHTSALARGPWWYRGHGSGFAAGWDFH